MQLRDVFLMPMLCSILRCFPCKCFHVIVAYLIIIVAFFVFLNLIVDILYSFLDPRVRIKGSSE